MVQEVGMNKLWQAFLGVECNAAKMLCIYRQRDVGRDYSTPTAGPHYRNQNIAGIYPIALKHFIFLRSDVPPPGPGELISYDVINAKNRDAFIHELLV